MARLIYIANTSLDGYTEDKEGSYAFSTPDDDGFRFITDLVRPAGTHIYGRRMYETMMVWETDPDLAAASPLMADFAGLWQAAAKIVYSKTLTTGSTRRTRIERDFDPAAIRRLKQRAGGDVLIGGPELTAHAFRAGLVDECHLFIAPVILGGGKPALPDDVRLPLELLAHRRFDNGVVYVGYRITPQ